jgi:hypothetical protein
VFVWKEVIMLRDVLASVSIPLLAGSAAFGQPLLPLLTSTPIPRR